MDCETLTDRLYIQMCKQFLTGKHNSKNIKISHNFRTYFKLETLGIDKFRKRKLTFKKEFNDDVLCVISMFV